MTVKARALSYIFRNYYEPRLTEFIPGHVNLDYRHDLRPRYLLPDRPNPLLHAWFESRREACHASLELIARYRTGLAAIPRTVESQIDPYWDNHWFSILDGMALYAFVADRRPARIVEIGSGNSTKFAARAIRDQQLATELTSIDPMPRAEIDGLCTRVLRQPAEDVSPAVFADLQPGDILFIDSSHRALMNSDVTAMFLEVVPRLPTGVLLHVHDVFLPFDYPAAWANRLYSEQYILASWLLAGPDRMRLLLSCPFVSFDHSLRSAASGPWIGSPLGELFSADHSYGTVPGLLGTSFWAEMK